MLRRVLFINDPIILLCPPWQIYLILSKNFSVSQNYFITNSHCNLYDDIEKYCLKLPTFSCLSINHHSQSNFCEGPWSRPWENVYAIANLLEWNWKNTNITASLAMIMFSYSNSLHNFLPFKHHSTMNVPSTRPLMCNKKSMFNQYPDDVEWETHKRSNRAPDNMSRALPILCWLKLSFQR